MVPLLRSGGIHLLLVFLFLPTVAVAQLSFSAGFSDDAVLQRSTVEGARIYGFAATEAMITVTVTLVPGHSRSSLEAAYSVPAVLSPWVPTAGCTRAGCIDPRTPQPPQHGNFTWVAQLRAQPNAGGSYTITVNSTGDDTAGGVNETIVLQRVTYGDVYFCRCVVGCVAP